jgi:threonine dehydrogenase-like Zn-dependent dehydrogenase
MRAIEARTFSRYGGLLQTELPKPHPAKDRVLVRVTAAGVTPLDHTILSGGHPRAKAPLVLGNEGAGVVEDAGDSGLAVGSRVMFTGPYGVREDGTWQEWQCLDHFTGLYSGDLICGLVDSLVGVCVEGGKTRYGVGLAIVEEHKIPLRWIALRINNVKSQPETLSLRLEGNGVTPWRRAGTVF